ncbi:MAG: hypothetical protein L0387_38820 [Acidobacteria bacterium]|nr:hypothetical protein [Acidobacteriota bacterium]MCI0720808.1 hypothetical protein [Acidobacteriota bacterium]
MWTRIAHHYILGHEELTVHPPFAEFVVQEGTFLRDEVTRQTIRAEGGYLAVPQEPGLGIELNMEAVERYRAA